MKAMTEWYDWGAFFLSPLKIPETMWNSGNMTFNCRGVSAAPGWGLAVRSDSVQAGALHPESLRGHHGAQSVCFEHWQVNSSKPPVARSFSAFHYLTQSLSFYIRVRWSLIFGCIFVFFSLKDELFFKNLQYKTKQTDILCHGNNSFWFSEFDKIGDLWWYLQVKAPNSFPLLFYSQSWFIILFFISLKRKSRSVLIKKLRQKRQRIDDKLTAASFVYLQWTLDVTHKCFHAEFETWVLNSNPAPLLGQWRINVRFVSWDCNKAAATQHIGQNHIGEKTFIKLGTIFWELRTRTLGPAMSDNQSLLKQFYIFKAYLLHVDRFFFFRAGHENVTHA